MSGPPPSHTDGHLVSELRRLLTDNPRLGVRSAKELLRCSIGTQRLIELMAEAKLQNLMAGAQVSELEPFLLSAMTSACRPLLDAMERSLNERKLFLDREHAERLKQLEYSLQSARNERDHQWNRAEKAETERDWAHDEIHRSHAVNKEAKAKISSLVQERRSWRRHMRALTRYISQPAAVDFRKLEDSLEEIRKLVASRKKNRNT